MYIYHNTNLSVCQIKTPCLVYHTSMITFGENLKNLRKINGLNQQDFATKLNTTQQRVSEWECNKVEPSLYNLIKITKVLNVTFEELTEGIE